MAPLSDDLSARIDELESELASNPTPAVFAPLADAYRLSGRLNSALETARRGAQAFPGHVGIRVVLARAVAGAEGRERALAAYRNVLELDPANIEARSFLDATPAHQDTQERLPAAGDDAEVRAAAPDEPSEQALLKDGTSESTLATGAGTLSEELAHLADLFEPTSGETTAASLQPSSIATLTLAEIYSRQGLYDKAAEVCEHILEREPDNEQARAALEEYRKHPASV
jgi:tetratricopeptide (TPR) repeat protein